MYPSLSALTVQCETQMHPIQIVALKIIMHKAVNGIMEIV